MQLFGQFVEIICLYFRKKTREHPPNLRSILHHTHRQDTGQNINIFSTNISYASRGTWGMSRGRKLTFHFK